MSDHPALETIAQLAVTSTGASHGWVLVFEGGQLSVGAAAGGAYPGELAGRSVPVDGTAGYVIESGQPVALQLQTPEGQPARDAEALIGVGPNSVLCVPCTYGDEARGALELIDKAGGGSFSFDDVEVAVMLGDVAGAVLAEGVPSALAPTPDELAVELRALAATDPGRYAGVAAAVGALLARS
jgi:GAF domain-containing protein